MCACSLKTAGEQMTCVSSMKRPQSGHTFGLFAGVGALQLQLLQSGWQVVFLLGGKILHVKAVVIQQQSQPLQRAF